MQTVTETHEVEIRCLVCRSVHDPSHYHERQPITGAVIESTADGDKHYCSGVCHDRASTQPHPLGDRSHLWGSANWTFAIA